MPLFTPSTIPWVSAVQSVADSAGASGDSEMTQRAHLSLRAAFQHFNARVKWNFLRAEATPINLVAPFTFNVVSASSGQASALVSSGHGLLVDDVIIGSGFIAGQRISATGSSSIGFFAAITGFSSGTAGGYTATALRDSYDLPSDWKSEYSIRLLGSAKVLTYFGRRAYDRTVVNENQAGTPDWYDLYNSYGRSKIRVLPAPAAGDVLINRYFRRMFVASASSIATTAIDIPEDYESYPIAWAKWHFLTDKREQGGQQATTWLSLAQEGLKTMIADQADVQDEDLRFVPAHIMPQPAGGDNSTRYLFWDT
jgi:hypothetical protein